MQICVYTYVYILYVFICMFIHIRVIIYIYKHIYIYIYIYVYIYIHVYIYIYIYARFLNRYKIFTSKNKHTYTISEGKSEIKGMCMASRQLLSHESANRPTNQQTNE